MFIYVVAAIIAVAVIALDQISKYITASSNVNAVIIPELLKFKLAYNEGAAFSFLSDAAWAQTFFKIITVVILLGIIGWAVYSIITKKTPSKWLIVAVSLVFGGATGNLIDRIAFNKVRDFIYVFYNTEIFPAIFNVADIALVVGVIMLCVYLLFLDKDAIFKKKSGDKNNGKNNVDSDAFVNDFVETANGLANTADNFIVDKNEQTAKRVD